MKDFVVNANESFIHVIGGSGFILNSENSEEFFEAPRDRADEQEIDRFFIDIKNIKWDLDTLQTFDAAIHASSLSLNPKVALLRDISETPEVWEFFRTVAMNRGADIEFFQDSEEALEWLESNTTVKEPSRF